ncbi:MAG: hypothetical protein GKS01_01545 [Alphaproteobacteria bacterium]|nr:hypothetical protein [Alphaproteobacteria bacterium]
MLKTSSSSVRQIILLAVIFAAMQIMALTHNVAHGDIHHSHDGSPCVFQITSDFANDIATRDDLNVSETLHPVRYISRQTTPTTQRGICANTIRAPPPITP